MWQMAVVPRWPDVLVVVVVVTAKFSVSEGVTLPQCVNGCFYMEDYHVIQIRCEELAVGEEVAWTIVYQDNNPEYSGKCNEPNRPGLCAPSGNGFTPTVQQSGDVSVLTIDLKSFRPNLNYHTLTCESGGQRAVCTIRYNPCSFTRLTSTSAPVLAKRTDSRMTDVTVPSDGPHIAAAVAGGLLGALVIAAVFVITIVCYKKRGKNLTS
ncbi:hypothetical protein BaRGS_00039152 [Batillaria attramentaria]|uniref:Uncharacterized protein n=1 Tax=Batillaria attramentaria TaxID=370345 RepID=A0ABD0J3P7_9CAEN